jgi:arylsulfatase A-like enzyme
MLGIPGLKGADGLSHVPLLLGTETRTDREFGFARLDRNWGRLETEESPVIAVREGNLRLIHAVESPEKDLLYDIEFDPRESRNLAESRVEDKEKLLARALEQMAQPPRWEGGSGSVEIDEMQLRQLRALGYSIE